MPVYRFGVFCLDTDAYRLTRAGDPAAASPRQLDLLAYLAARPSQLVTREALFQALWPDVIVTDNALTQLVSELRQTLGDSSGSPEYVQTVARRGYRFIASVVPVDSPGADPVSESNVRERRGRETSNLDALRAATEGRLQLEALDSARVEPAIENFDRAISLDPSFSAAYVGRANARFWLYERSRSGYRPDSALLAAAVSDARRGIELAPEFAEAHATLAYLLTAAARADEARAAAREAIALEPKHWSHHFRLGHAAWGAERLGALRRCLQLYPAFPFAHFQMAMVHVARQELDTASRVLEEGIAVLEGTDATRSRFPASGLYWLRGSIRLTRDDLDGALADFECELQGSDSTLYASEFSVAALNSRGFALVRAARPKEAEEAFRRSLAAHQEQARVHLGLAVVAGGRQQPDSEAVALAQADDAIDHLGRGSRTVEAALMAAGKMVVEQQLDEAAGMLDRFLTEMPPGAAGWSIPIDPLFRSLGQIPTFGHVLDRLTWRAE